MGIDHISAPEPTLPGTGFPELTELGRRVEMLRIERSISKQHLARHAGISRQQLWRVMTGKSELTPGLCARLAEALRTDPAEIANGVTHLPIPSAKPQSATDLEGYLGNANAIAHTLATLPHGDAGRSLKRELLNALEDHALARGHKLGAAFFDIRRRVITGEL